MVIVITHKRTRGFKTYRSYNLYLRHSTWILHKNKCIFLPHSMELLISQLVKKLPAFCGIWNFINIFTTAPHMSLFLSHIIESTSSNPTSWKPMLILYSHLWLGILSVLFLTDFTTLNLCELQVCTFISVNYTQKHLTI